MQKLTCKSGGHNNISLELRFGGNLHPFVLRLSDLELTIPEQHDPGFVNLPHSPRRTQVVATVSGPETGILEPIITQLREITDDFARLSSDSDAYMLGVKHGLNQALVAVMGQLGTSPLVMTCCDVVKDALEAHKAKLS